MSKRAVNSIFACIPSVHNVIHLSHCAMRLPLPLWGNIVLSYYGLTRMNSALARNAVTLSACALSHNRLTRRIILIRRLCAHSMKRISRNSPLFSWRTVLVGRLIVTTVHIAPLVPRRQICVPEKGRWISCVKMVNRTGLKDERTR